MCRKIVGSGNWPMCEHCFEFLLGGPCTIYKLLISRTFSRAVVSCHVTAMLNVWAFSMWKLIEWLLLIYSVEYSFNFLMLRELISLSHMVSVLLNGHAKHTSATSYFCACNSWLCNGG